MSTPSLLKPSGLLWSEKSGCGVSAGLLSEERKSLLGFVRTEVSEEDEAVAAAEDAR